MAERRAAAKSRRMGSSRRKQLREGSSEAPVAAPSPGEELPWASEILQKVQDFFREQDKDQVGFVTRSDMQKLQEKDFPCSTEELELVFDGLDTAGTGRLSTDEFAAGLRQFLGSQKAARGHHRRKTASRRVRLVLPSPALEGADSEERGRFAAFMDQLGTDSVSEEQEIWQLWVKLRQDEPQLLGNLEDFLAKMRQRIQEARSKKEALEVTLNKRVAEHDKEVQQLCEALEQQIQQEQQRLEQESVARSHQHSMELQQALDASEREVQRLVAAQVELETRCRSLRRMQQATSSENQQLEESNRALEDLLQHLHQQLQQTQGRLQTVRATVAWEHAEEPGDRAVAELPGETPMSPQMSPEKSEQHRSEMQLRLGSQSSNSKAKSTHQVVWEMLPAERSLLGARPRASWADEDPFPEFLREERFAEQSSLLREMNDAIAALSTQLKPQAPSAPLTPAATVCHPQDRAKPQTGLEAAAAHGTAPEVLRETLPGHVGHELLEGDLKEGPAAAEHRAPDVTQAGASGAARHHTAQEMGTEQGESPEEAGRMLFLQEKGTGVKELKVAEHLQGALGGSTEAGEQALVEGEGWIQEKTGWEKAQPSREAEEEALSQGGNLEAGLGPPEAGDTGLAVGWQLVTDELGPAVAPRECVQPLGTGLGAEAPPPSGLSEELGIKPGECLEPEPPSWGEAQRGAAHGDGDPKVTVAPGPGLLEEEPWGETSDVDVLPDPGQHGGSSGAGAVEGEMPREAEPQPQGESAGGGAAWGGSSGAEVPLPAAVPPADGQDGGVGTDGLETQSTDANMQLLAEVEAALQPPSGAGSPGMEQGGSVAPDVQPLDQVDKPGLVELEMEDAQADVQLWGGLSPEASWGGEGGTAPQLVEEAEEGERGLGECELSHEAVLHPCGLVIRQGEGAGAGVHPQEEAEILDTLEDQNTGANVQPLAEEDELESPLGGSTEVDLQDLSEAISLDTEQGGRGAPDVQPLDQVDKPESVEMVEAEDIQADTELPGGASLETFQGREDCVAVQLREEAEDGEQGQGEHELLHEPVLDLQGAGARQGEGAGAGVQAPEEAEILETLEDQSTDANVQLLLEMDELELTPGGSMEADEQPLREARSPGTEQGGSVAPDVQPLDQVDKPEVVELEMEDAQADVQLWGGLSPEASWGGEGGTAPQLVEEAEDGELGLGECELSHEAVLHPCGLVIRQGEGAGAGVQAPEEAEILDTLEGQSTGANVQPLAEEDELESPLGGSTEVDLQDLSEAISLDTEQGGSGAPDVQPLDQADKPESVEMVEAEDTQADRHLWGDASPNPPWGGWDCAAVQLREEAEDGEQGQGEHELLHEPVLDLQGEGAGAGVQPPEEAEILDMSEHQNTDANVQLLAEELKITLGGRTEVDVAPLHAAGLWEGGQSQTLGVEAGLCTADVWEGAAGADVSPLAEATSHSERATAAEGPGLESKLGALTGPGGQILEDTQTLEILQGERGDAEERPLDGAQGLEVVQGERLEVGARIFVETQGLGMKQGHDDSASVLAPPVSEVTLQISTLKLESMMQEDVLVPDVWRLNALGQTAQSELQEQVSAQADKVLLPAASQQPEEKPPHVMETKQGAAGPAEPPKQEVPPASTLHTRVRQEEDAGNDQLGMVLGGSLRGDAANSSMQPQRQLLGEQSKDLSVGQQEKPQEVGQKMSQEGEPSPGEPGAVTVDGAEAAPRGSPEACLDPDHLYNVLFVGDSHVGKTSFLYRLHADAFNPHLTATVGLDYRVKNLIVDNKRFALRLWDSAGQERYRSVTKQFFRKADGVVLMYDITSEYSFSDVRYWLSCIQEGAEDRVAILLLGNKTDCAAERQVPTKEGERLAKEQQLMFFECSAASGHNVSESMVSFVRLLKVREDELKNKAEVPKPPQKKKGCCW